uniref:Uncharacterized protein n=1 Tax=Ananas comosus var. bracteatus TaxID=296719 RepID=A0A6V7P5S7_ANACO|nr:unnamed protein product [Ananas comosus var. bracteatus]
MRAWQATIDGDGLHHVSPLRRRARHPRHRQRSCQGAPPRLPHHRATVSDAPCDHSALHRLLRFLAHKGIFAEREDPSTGEPAYAPTPTSRWFSRRSELSLASMVLLQTWSFQESPWHRLSERVVRCGGGVEGMGMPPHKEEDPWADLAAVPECAAVFNSAMAAMSGIAMRAVMAVYKASTALLRRRRLSEDTKELPEGDARKYGKLIIVDAVLGADDDDDDGGSLEDMKKTFDMLMLAYTGGKERTEAEWRKLLRSGGFPTCNIIRIPSFFSIIEAFAE